MNITDRFMRALDEVSSLRSAMLDELQQMTDHKSMEYLLLEKEFHAMGNVIKIMTARGEEE